MLGGWADSMLFVGDGGCHGYVAVSNINERLLSISSTT